MAGTGLGLAISSRLVTMMGAASAWKSEPGKGSTFHFNARFLLQTAPAKTPQAIARNHSLAFPVLVVVTMPPTSAFFLRCWKAGSCKRPGQRATSAGYFWNSAEPGNAFPLVLVDSWMPEKGRLLVAEQSSAK